MVDHINGNPSDNRIANLREASDAQNCLNRKIRSDNKSGEKGVSADPKGWRARINVNGKTVHLGYFESIDLAADAARRARERFHGEFCRHS
jgi:hypothetical protein